MRPPTDARTQHVAEWWGWEVARREETRVARRRYRQQEAEGVYRLAAGAVVDDGGHVLQRLGVMALLAQGHGAAIHREMVPDGPYGWLDGLQTRFGMARRHARPALLCREAALRQRVGFTAQHGRQGVCQRGATQRPGARTPGPISPEPVAHQIVTRHVRDRASVCHGANSRLGAGRHR
jgi:hypothetical protein